MSELSEVLAARRARLSALAEQLKGAANKRASQERAAKQVELERGQAAKQQSERDRDQQIATARSTGEARLATARADTARQKAAADADRAAAAARADAQRSAARQQASAQVSTATAQRDAARTSGDARVADARARAAQQVAAAQADKDRRVAEASQQARRQMEAANAQLSAANQRQAAVDADQVALNNRRAELEEQALHCHDQVTLLGYHGWYGSFVNNKFGAYTQGFTSSSALWLVKPAALLDNGPLRYGDAVAVTCSANRYLQATPQGAVNMDATAVGAWETWTLLNAENVWATGALVGRRARIALRSSHGRFLVAESNGVVNANRADCGPWESWVLDVKSVVRFPPPAPVNPGFGFGNLNLGNISFVSW